LSIVNVRIQVRQLPRDHVLVSISFIRPAIPSKGALVNYLRDLVQKVRQVGLEHLSVVNKLVNFANHEYGVDFLAWNHDLQISIT